MIGITNVKKHLTGTLEVTVSCEGPANATVHILYGGMQYTGTGTKTILVDYNSSIEYWATAPDYYESSHTVQTNIIINSSYTIGELTIMPSLTIDCYTPGATITINGVVGNSRHLAAGTSYTYSVSKTNYQTKTGSGTMPSTDTTVNVGYLDLTNISLNSTNDNVTIYSETLYNSKTATISMTGAGNVSKTNSNSSADWQIGNGGTASGTIVIPANTKLTIKCLAGYNTMYSNLNGSEGIALILTDSNDTELGMLVVGGAGNSYYNYSIASYATYYAAGGGGYNGGKGQCYDSGQTSGNLINTSGYSIDGTQGTNQTMIAGTATGSRTTNLGNSAVDYGGTGYASGLCSGATLTNGTLGQPVSSYIESDIPKGQITITFS